MELIKKLETIADELNAELKDSKNVKEENKKIDEEWLEFISAERELKSNGKKCTIKELYRKAKEEKEYVISAIAKSDPKEQIELSKKLININNIITAYEKEFERKEQNKKTNSYENKGMVIKKAIISSIESINEEISALDSQFEEHRNNLSIAGSEKNNELLKKMNKINSSKASLEILKNALSGLLTCNQYSINNYYAQNDISKLPKKYVKVVEYYYTLIKFNGINMNEFGDVKAPVKQQEPTKQEPPKKQEPKQPTQVDPVNDKIDELISKAEKTNKYKDFYTAITFAKQNLKKDEPLNEDFKTRFENIIKVNSEKFVEVLEKVKNDISSGQPLVQSLVLLLKDKFQFLSKEDATKYYDELEHIIISYNIDTQEDTKEKHDIENEKKYSLFERVSEFVGKPITLLASSKLGYKFTEGRLKKAEENLANAQTGEERDTIKERINRIINSLVNKDTASGLRLYNARNYIRKIKPKLYSGTPLSNLEEVRFENSKMNLSQAILNKLEKVVELDGVKDSKERVINVMDQYVELLATIESNDELFDDIYNDSLNFLHTTSVLNPEEMYAYEQQISLIYNYRIATNFDIYELSKDKEDGSYEVDSIAKYSDSDVNVYRNNKQFVLRRK